MITYLGAAANEKASRTGGNKIPYEWNWPPAKVHLGTNAIMNVFLKLDTVLQEHTAAGAHRLL